jgi:hypothetical protein
MLGSIYLRDALMDRSPGGRAFYRGELQRLREEVEAALVRYEPQVDTPREREGWTSLQAALDNYWRSREMVLAVGERDGTEGGALVIRTVIPARESVLELVNSLGALEQASIEAHEAEVAEFHQGAERRVVTLASLSLVVGLFVAFVASGHVVGLEGEIERRRMAELQNRVDLERLSAKLVTAQEEERRRLARELHDAVGQALTAIRLEMGVALHSGAQEPRARKRSRTLEASRKRRCRACGTCRSFSTRRCSMTSACRRRSPSTPAASAAVRASGRRCSWNAWTIVSLSMSSFAATGSCRKP